MVEARRTSPTLWMFPVLFVIEFGKPWGGSDWVGIWRKALWDGVTTTVQLALYSLDTDHLPFSCKTLDYVISMWPIGYSLGSKHGSLTPIRQK